MVDNEFGAPQMVVGVAKHVFGLKAIPFELGEVKTPDDRSHVCEMKDVWS